MNIIHDENYFNLFETNTLINQLRFSIAGGKTYLITELKNEKQLDPLMDAFIHYCEQTRYRLIPLIPIVSQYFIKYPEKRCYLRGLDIRKLQKHLTS